MQMGDLASMIPRIEQGQQTFELQTLGELKERLDKAGKYLGMVIQHYDRLTEWAGLNFYRANMLNPNAASAMGSFKVKALGFTSFMNKTVRLKGLVDVLMLAKSDPDLKLMTRLKGLYTEIIKGYDVDPDQILKTAQEMETEAAQNQALLASMQGDKTENNRVEMELQARTQRLLAEAHKAEAQATAIAEDMTLKRAKVVTELEQQRTPAPVATPSPTPAVVAPAVAA
ncbi:MAG: hypothetical protein NTY53_24095 [Kiritimatiellaeota bacterium]|nr:hypothetical protein [Kiritimatiellota bacterium]